MRIAAKRLLAVTCVVVMLLSIFALTTLRISVWRFQRNAEQLFSRVAALEIDKTTIEDVQALAKLYGPEVGSQGEKCDTSECKYDISLLNFPYRHRLDWKFLRALGIRPAAVLAQITVANGKATGTLFQVFYRSRTGDWLRVNIEAKEAFSHRDECIHFSLQRHPGYVVSLAFLTGGMFGVSVDSEFTPLARQTDRARIQAINWSCLTRLDSCEGPTPYESRAALSFVPAPYAQYLSDRAWEEENPEKERQLERSCGLPPWK
jgi:hypothetical protein